VPGVVPGAASDDSAGRGKARIRTDLYVAEISSLGGDITRLELVRHPETGDKSKNFVLFDNGGKHIYLAQSGVIGEGLPNHKTEWKLAAGDHVLKDGEQKLELRLEANTAGGAKVAKTYVFQRGQLPDRAQARGVTPGAHAYYQITRDGKPAEGQDNSMMMGVVTFTGPAVFTDAEKFQKVEFADILKNKAKFAQKADNGWLAMVQHYFVAAWLPAAGTATRVLHAQGRRGPVFGGRDPAGRCRWQEHDNAVCRSAGTGQAGKDRSRTRAGGGLRLADGDRGALVLGAGRHLQAGWELGLGHHRPDLVVEAGIFFPLSAASYKSMAKMRVLTPKLMKLKETYGDDKQRLNQEMMALYKKEKVNPLGGCLPVLVQIPVFIALYWVLLGTVEMRNAPWLGWITDLSVKDPYYVLPLIMGATMFIQTKLNPTPPDPIQAKVMLLHAGHFHRACSLVPGRSGSLLDGEQHPFDCAAMANHPSSSRRERRSRATWSEGFLEVGFSGAGRVITRSGRRSDGPVER
jgi:YidC/Oxa1 family membrane protein insertase